ncbi:putative glycoside hydrolase family 28 protein [Diaporthe ampelina]|uniref:Putative glycoside hydrolase family 28 protein n=1 Tax=Diaporthe ampelina TaxID=1214573 RepID=A0A0G2FSW9_9PEZI|nr:putative glycoside hydrolase family 28 protein [Diaporthe ampelina]
MKLSVLNLFVLVGAAVAQLTGHVGPTTKTAAKRSKKTCNVLDYGAKADKKTDLGAALTKAWSACASGGIVVIPKGDYAMSTWATLNKGTGVGVQLDGTIYRTGTAGGNMIAIQNSKDIEFFSSNGSGVMQGYGYEIHKSGSLSGARLLRVIKTSDFSVHDLKFVDAPAFHISLDTSTNGELYNLAIRGGDHGGLDGIDVWGTNIHIHDVMVTNKDECVTVKSPAQNILIEQIYCNLSGGSAIGSLAAGTAISNIAYRKIYTVGSNQMMMIKSNGGSGYVEDVEFSEFIGHGNAYSLDVDQSWASMSAAAGSGVQLTNMTFSNWKGTCASGTQRGPIQFKCDPDTPCRDMAVKDFAMWTDSGSKVNYICQNAFGSGGCLKGSGSSYTTTAAVASAPTGYKAATMPGDLKTGFGFTVEIPVPTMPSSFFPGATPLVALAH